MNKLAYHDIAVTSTTALLLPDYVREKRGRFTYHWAYSNNIAYVLTCSNQHLN